MMIHVLAHAFNLQGAVCRAIEQGYNEVHAILSQKNELDTSWIVSIQFYPSMPRPNNAYGDSTVYH